MVCSPFATAWESEGSIVFSSAFFSASTKTHELLHLARLTLTLTTARSLLNIKVVDQKSMSRVFLCVMVSLVCLFICQQDYSKSYELISMKRVEGLGVSLLEKVIRFWWRS